MSHVLLLLAALLLAAPEEELPVIGQCDPVGASRDERLPWTKEMREEVRQRVKWACRHELKASPIVCAYYDAVVVRESSGRASIRHTLGKGENGLGAMGLSLRWHHDKWPGKDEDPAWCTPEASLITAHAIVWRAFDRYHAENALDIQAVYGQGGGDCFMQYNPKTRKEKRVCYASPTNRTVKSICSRMKARGFSCYQRITKKDLGLKVPRSKRRAWVEQVLENLPAPLKGDAT